MTYAVNVIYGHNIGDDSHTLLLVRLGSPDSFVKTRLQCLTALP
jgi:hypothetical protein